MSSGQRAFGGKQKEELACVRPVGPKIGLTEESCPVCRLATEGREEVGEIRGLSSAHMTDGYSNTQVNMD